MHLSEFLIDKKLVETIKKKGPQMQKNLEGALQVVTKLTKVAEDGEDETQDQTGNVYTTR